jgi:hypothetical protein
MNNKNIDTKTKEERKEEINNIVRLLFQNKYHMGIDGMPQFLEIAKEYIDNGTNWEGEIEMIGTRHKLIGNLTNKKNKKCNLMLKFIK